MRDHEGKPVANGWVFFIPKGHHSNIVEGLTGVDAHLVPSDSHDASVSEVRTNANGTFALPTGTDGTLAASTDLVDLWPFALPEDGHAELKMPAPSYLVIDLTYWYLDDFAKKGKRAYSSASEDPNQFWILVSHAGSVDPLWKALEYRRLMFVFAKDPRAKLSKGVTIEHVIEGEMPEPIPDVGHNKNLSTKIRVALPPGSYRLQRLRAGPFAPVEEQMVHLKFNGTVISALRVNDKISNKVIFSFPELDKLEMERLVPTIRESIKVREREKTDEMDLGSVKPRAVILSNARSVVEAYVSSALAGDVAKAAALAKSSPADPKQIGELPKFFNVQRLKIETVYINDPAKPTQALATSVAVKLEEQHKNPDGRRDGVLIFKLEFTDDTWFVIDIDFETESGTERHFPLYRIGSDLC